MLGMSSSAIFNLLFFIVYHNSAGKNFGNETTKINNKWIVYQIYGDKNISKDWLKDQPGKIVILHDSLYYVDIMLNEDLKGQFEKELKHKRLNYTITTRDLQKLIETLEVRDQNFSFQHREFDEASQEKVHFDHSSYHSYSDISSFLQDLSTNYPDIAAVQTIGYSFQNQKIQTIQISDPLYSTSKRAIWIDGGTHAREWVSVAAALYVIDKLVKGYASSDILIKQNVQNITWFITSVVNPDGYEYTRSSSDPQVRLWRKNRNGYCGESSEKSCCIGVDLNRNYGYMWSGKVINRKTIFVPPLTLVLKPSVNLKLGQLGISYKASKVDTLLSYISFHSYSQLWMYPYDYQKNTYPPNVDSLKNLAARTVDSIRKLNNAVYRYGTVPKLLYIAPGGGHDWVKSIGVKYTYTVELRPDLSAFNGFIISPDELIPTSKDAWTGIQVVADQILQDTGLSKVTDNEGDVKDLDS